LKITGIRTRQIEIPFEKPLRTAIHHITGIAVLLVWVDTDEGVTGESYLWTMSRRWLPAFEAAVRGLEPTVIGRDPRDSEALFADMWRDINFVGHKGLSIFGLSALDWACWDIRGKAEGRAVSRILGRSRDRVRAYASGGLWGSLTIDELQAEARAFVAQGFTAVKMRFGKPDIGEDVERTAAVREAIGPSVELMADANQGFTVNHAIRLGRRIEQFELTWFEEPVQAYDLAGSARVAAELDTPIASGETEYTRYGFQDMLERGSADVLMPDLQRVGGVSEWIKVAHMAAAKDIPVSPHTFSEHSLQLCAAVSNLEFSEHMPWFEALFVEEMPMVDGYFEIPDRPGLGFTFDADAVERLAVR